VAPTATTWRCRRRSRWRGVNLAGAVRSDSGSWRPWRLRVSALKGERRDPCGRIDRTDNSALIRRFCHWPVGVGVSLASMPNLGDRSDECDETVASVSCACCDDASAVHHVRIACTRKCRGTVSVVRASCRGSRALARMARPRPAFRRTDSSAVNRRFCRLCHRPASAALSAASIPGPGDRSDESDQAASEFRAPWRGGPAGSTR